MIRKMMWAVLAVGVALIAAPFVMGLPDKADGGQQMIDAFAPIMDEQNVELTADYYYSRSEQFVTDLLPQLGTSLGRLNPNFGPYLPPADHPDPDLVLAALDAAVPPELRPFLDQRHGEHVRPIRGQLPRAGGGAMPVAVGLHHRSQGRR